MSRRPLNTIETFMANAHATGMGTSQVVTLFHVEPAVDAGRLHYEFLAYCRAHAVLASRIVPSDGRWCLEFDGNQKEPRFEKFVSSGQGLSVDKVVEAEANDILDPNYELLRLRHITARDLPGVLLVLVQHHAITDTYSAKRIMSDLLLAASGSGPTSHSPIRQYKLPDQPSDNSTVPNDTEHSASARDGRDLKSALRSLHLPSGAEARTGIETLCIDAQTVAALTNYCRLSGFSFNTGLTALITSCVIDLLEVDHIDTHTAVSARASILHSCEIGCCIDIFSCAIGSHEDGSGALLFENNIKNAKSAANMSLLVDSITPARFERPHLNTDSAIRECQGIGFTNSGRCTRIVTPGGSKLISYRSIANRTSGNLLMVFHVSFQDDVCIISIAFSYLLLSRSHVACFSNKLTDALHKLCSTG